MNWSAIIKSLPFFFIGLFTAPFLNNVGDLAVTESMLPEMGESNFDYEVQVQGWAHIAAGLGGGFPSDFGNDDSQLHRIGGGKTRLSAALNVIMLSFFFFASCPAFPVVPAVIAVIPKFLNGASMLLAAIEMLSEALVESYGSLPVSEYMVIVTVSVATLYCEGAIEKALLVGLILSFCVFVFQASKSNVLSFVEEESDTLWPDESAELLSSNRNSIAVARLEGYLFFANAKQVVVNVVEKLETKVVKVLIVDFSRLEKIDDTACCELDNLLSKCAAKEVKVIFAGLSTQQMHLLLKEEVIEYPERFKSMLLAAGNADELSKEQVLALLSELIDDVEMREDAWVKMMPNDEGMVTLHEVGYVLQKLYLEEDEERNDDTQEDDDEPDCDIRTTSSLSRALQLAQQTLLDENETKSSNSKSEKLRSAAAFHGSLLQRAEATINAMQKSDETDLLLRLISNKSDGPELHECKDGEIIDATKNIWVIIYGTVELYLFFSDTQSSDKQGNAIRRRKRLLCAKKPLAVLEPIKHMPIHNMSESPSYVVQGSTILMKIPTMWLKSLDKSDANQAAAIYSFIYKKTAETYAQLMSIRGQKSVLRYLHVLHKSDTHET